MGHFRSLTVLLIVSFVPTIAGSLDKLCKSEQTDEIVAELCVAKMEAEALQERIEGIAEKVAPDTGVEKRKNEFVRFGRSDAGENFDTDSHGLTKRKNEFVRFGKRKNEFVRFGKRKNEFVRFGKRKNEGDMDMEKRKNEFVRFG